MQSMTAAPLTWTSQFTIAPSSRTPKLSGDKILLPPSALEQLLSAAPIVSLDDSNARSHTSAFDPFNPYTYAQEREARSWLQDRQQQLPYPLTFRLVNPKNGRIIYAGIREFSAEEGEIAASPFIWEALGVEAEASVDQLNDPADARETGLSKITVHAQQLPKGSFVKLRPLEAGYDPDDWKALLEQYLRVNFTTLTNGEVLVVQGGFGRKNEQFRFLVDGFRPEGQGICVVDTDLEVDIEALNEEQARETLRKITEKSQRAVQSISTSSAGGKLEFMRSELGQVLPGEYVDYELESWNRSEALEITLTGEKNDQIDLFVSPFSDRQRARPREDEYIFCDSSSQLPKRILIQPTNVELQNADSIWLSVRAFSSEEASPIPLSYEITAQSSSIMNGTPGSDNRSTVDHAGETQCKNCQKWVPQGSLFLHENFCIRNNILCPQGCNEVFQKNSSEFKNHWHCPHDSTFGNTPDGLVKHERMFHKEADCPSCSLSFSSLRDLALHRTSTCPGKLILCRFCHLQVPQEGDPEALTPDPEVVLSGLTPHELADGARTTECHMCNKIVRLRDMDTHIRHHDFEKLSRPEPRVCRNTYCGRTLDGVNKSGDTRAGLRMGQGPGNEVGLCSICFGPLYVSMYDPDGRALKRRVERRYLSQLLTGCGKTWCNNEYCKTGRMNNTGEPKTISTKDAIPLIKPFLEGLAGSEWSSPLHFCVDETSQKRRNIAEVMAVDKGVEGRGGYGLPWCVAALEAEAGDPDKAMSWLKNWAPQRLPDRLG